MEVQSRRFFMDPSNWLEDCLASTASNWQVAVSVMSENMAYTVVDLLGLECEEEKEEEKSREKKGREKHHPPLTLGRFGNGVYAVLPDTGCQVLS